MLSVQKSAPLQESSVSRALDLQQIKCALFILEEEFQSNSHEKLSECLTEFKKAVDRSGLKLPPEVAVRVTILESLLLQREGNLAFAEVYMPHLLNDIKRLKMEGLSKQEQNRVGSALNEYATNVALRIGYDVYLSFIDAVKNIRHYAFKDPTPGELIAEANQTFNDCDLQKTTELLQEAQNKLDKNTNNINRSPEYHEDRGNVINILVALHMHSGEYEEALEIITETLGKLKLSNRLLVNLWRKAADIHMMMGENEKAASCLEHAKSIFYNWKNDHLQFTTEIREGILLSRQGYISEALQKFYDLRNLPQINEGQKSLLLGNAGLVLERMGLCGGTIEDIEPHILAYFQFIASEIDMRTPLENPDIFDLALDWVEAAYRIQYSTPLSRLILGTNLLTMYASREMEFEKWNMERELEPLYLKIFQGPKPEGYNAILFGWDLL